MESAGLDQTGTEAPHTHFGRRRERPSAEQCSVNIPVMHFPLTS